MPEPITHRIDMFFIRANVSNIDQVGIYSDLSFLWNAEKGYAHVARTAARQPEPKRVACLFCDGLFDVHVMWVCACAGVKSNS